MFRIIITDLDGSLLDHVTYDYTPALPALELLREKGIPVVFCTSKSAAEVLALREEVGNTHPFIVENGGAIYLPGHAFTGANQTTRAVGNYQMISWGRPMTQLKEQLEKMGKQLGLQIQSFDEMTPEQISRETGLALEQARRALVREFDLPFQVETSPADLDRLGREVQTQGFKLSRGGRYFHLTGHNDKGRAVRMLIEWYRQQCQEAIQTIGIGDGSNDLDLLREVDVPVVIPNPHSGTFLAEEMPAARRAPLPGPAGWNAVVTAILEEESFE